MEEIKTGLDGLRNKAVACFFMIDLLLMVFVLSLKMSINSDVGGVVFNYTCGDEGQYYEIDPIGFTFIFVFGILMFVQFVGMLIHRRFTLLQWVATTVTCGSIKVNSGIDTSDLSSRRTSYKFAEEMMRMDESSDEEDNKKQNDDENDDEDDDFPIKTGITYTNIFCLELPLKVKKIF